MPSFYPRTMPHHLPLTPPEFVPSYNTNGCGGLPYSQAAYNHSSATLSDKNGFDYSERYGQPSFFPHPNSMYHHASGGYSMSSLRHATSFYEPTNANVLPPLRAQASVSDMHISQPHSHTDTHHRLEQQPKEEKAVGGVSAKLDYDMEHMTDFVADMAQGIVQPNRPMPPSFRKWVHQVLCATRLPSATILLSMHYLSIRMAMISKGGQQYKGSDVQIYRLLTIALLLGSKFLDDNTFINRSWSEVSGISVADLNRLETEWLVAIGFKLHREPAEPQGFEAWKKHWHEYERRARDRAAKATKLAPIDTSMQHASKSFGATYRSSYGKPTAPEFIPKAQAQYTPAYSPYDPWMSQRSAQDHSPSSAPTSGPTTPEYFSGSGGWASDYSNSVFAYQPPAPAQNQTHAHHPSAAFGSVAYTPQYGHSVWNAHPFNCSCFHCLHRHPSYFMSHSYGPQTVAG